MCKQLVVSKWCVGDVYWKFIIVMGMAATKNGTGDLGPNTSSYIFRYV